MNETGTNRLQVIPKAPRSRVGVRIVLSLALLAAATSAEALVLCKNTGGALFALPA
jgi:hypothetical protein